MVEDYMGCLNRLNTKGGKTTKVGGGVRKKKGRRNEKSRSPDMHSAAEDDKGCGDSVSCLCLGLAMTLYGRHCQVKGTYTLKEDRHSFV